MKLLKMYWDWVAQTFSKACQSDVERYLSQARDAADLEHRMSQLSRRGLL